MNFNLQKIWLEDGLIITSRYQDKIAAEGINSAKSLGQRTDDKEWQFYSLLFEDVSITGKVSILDIGCGRGELLSFVQNNYSAIKIERYLGIDLVGEFLNSARLNYPKHEFQQINFISDKFLLQENFTIVVALGVLVSRVRNYKEFVDRFIKKMVAYSSSHVLFNLISQVDLFSPNYSNYQQVGRSTFFPRETLESILNKIENISYRIVERQIFPDATDMFVSIAIKK